MKNKIKIVVHPSVEVEHNPFVTLPYMYIQDGAGFREIILKDYADINEVVNHEHTD